MTLQAVMNDCSCLKPWRKHSIFGSEKKHVLYQVLSSVVLGFNRLCMCWLCKCGNG